MTTRTAITVPAHAITGTGNRTRAFLTAREAMALLTTDGCPQEQIDALLNLAGDDYGYAWCLSTGAKITPVPTWQRGKVSTRARVWQVYGYHYAGTDVSSLFTVR
jgi:hypothetical protein